MTEFKNKDAGKLTDSPGKQVASAWHKAKDDAQSSGGDRKVLSGTMGERADANPHSGFSNKGK